MALADRLSLPSVCGACGQTFHDGAVYARHLDHHYFENRAKSIASKPLDFSPATLRDADLARTTMYFMTLGMPIQCGACGLRFHDDATYARHLDQHYERNHAKKTGRQFQHFWPDANAPPPAPVIVPAEEPFVLMDEDRPAGALCAERFDVVVHPLWNEFAFRGAVHHVGGGLAHWKCAC